MAGLPHRRCFRIIGIDNFRTWRIRTNSRQQFQEVSANLYRIMMAGLTDAGDCSWSYYTYFIWIGNPLHLGVIAKSIKLRMRINRSSFPVGELAIFWFPGLWEPPMWILSSRFLIAPNVIKQSCRRSPCKAGIQAFLLQTGGRHPGGGFLYPFRRFADPCGGESEKRKGEIYENADCLRSLSGYSIRF